MEAKSIKYNIVKAESRGHASHGWLTSHHSFSFANYYNPERIHFGALRVLNDDTIAHSEGFGKHPHDNMEIITIPLRGELSHGDSMGNSSVIREGEIQVMSAGTGVIHSEVNSSKTDEVELLQIWIIPNKKSVQPRYEQIALDKSKMLNKFGQILSPDANDDGVWIHQNAWFHMGEFEKGVTQSYKVKNAGDGLYIFIIEGSAAIDGHKLNKRDALTVSDAENVTVTSEENSKVLIIEVPMAW